MVAFYVFAAVYSVAVQPDTEQTVAKDLGSDQGTFGLIAAGVMIVCVAPLRGGVLLPRLLLRALRSASCRWRRRHRRRAVRPHPLRLLGHRRPADPAPAGAAGLHLLPRVRETGSLYPGHSPALDQQLRSPTGPRRRRLGGLRRARAADADRMRAAAAAVGSGAGAALIRCAAMFSAAPAIVSRRMTAAPGPLDRLRRACDRPGGCGPDTGPAGPGTPRAPAGYAGSRGRLCVVRRHGRPRDQEGALLRARPDGRAARPRPAVRGRPGGHASGGPEGQAEQAGPAPGPGGGQVHLPLPGG